MIFRVQFGVNTKHALVIFSKQAGAICGTRNNVITYTNRSRVNEALN